MFQVHYVVLIKFIIYVSAYFSMQIKKFQPLITWGSIRPFLFIHEPMVYKMRQFIEI